MSDAAERQDCNTCPFATKYKVGGWPTRGCAREPVIIERQTSVGCKYHPQLQRIELHERMKEADHEA